MLLASSRAKKRRPGHQPSMKSRAFLLLLSLLAAGAPSASAAPGDAPPAVDLPRWEWGVGLGAAWLRDYPGSAHQSAYALPYPWFVWRSERAEIGRGGARGVLVHSPRYQIDFTLGANPPSDSENNPERKGMPDLDAVIEPGLRLQWRTLLDDAGRWRLDLRLPARMAYHLDERLRAFPLGVHTEPGIAFSRLLAPGLRWGISASLGFAEARYNNFYYGVPPSAATPDRPAYDAGSGYTGAGVGTSLGWKHGRLATGLFLRVDLIDGASYIDSPLVTTREGYGVGGYFNWRIDRSRRSVSGDALEE